MDSTTGRRVRHRKHANPFTINAPIHMPPWEQIYGRVAPFALDVGFGEGGFLLDLARLHPEWNVLGLEIRPHLVRQAIHAAAEHNLPNVHAMLANVNAHLDSLIPDRTIAFVAVNFPDPWFKRRHRKRRVVCRAWIDTLLPKLNADAQIHLMSDYGPLAHDMRNVIEAHPGLHNMDGPMQWATQSTTGIQTEREIKHMGRGESIFRMRYALTDMGRAWQKPCKTAGSSGMEGGKSVVMS